MPDPPPALALAPLAVAAVLAVAAAGKLRRPRSGPREFVALRVPLVLRRPWVVRLHPWAELAIATGLLGAPAPWRWVPGMAAVGLLAGYLALVVRLVLRGERVACACFGATEHPVTGWTVARNAALLVGAALAALDCLTTASPVHRALTNGAAGAAWVTAAAVVAAGVWAGEALTEPVDR